MVAAGDGGAAAASLLETPTWALAIVCFIFIFLGLFIEHLIHLTGRWLKKHKKAALYEAMEKLKSVLMLLGFISLILTVSQRFISKICVPNNVANSMLPCRILTETKTTVALEHLWMSFTQNGPQTEIVQDINEPGHNRRLASGDSSSLDHCTSKGMTSLMSQEGITQLSIFIFMLAVMQIVSSVATMGLGRAKMKKWKSWEKETKTVEYMVANDPERFRYIRQTTFGRRHLIAFSTNPALLWIKCFFRQFFNSVAKIDYVTLRHGFISTHLSINNSFDFRKYIQRSLEDDFKAVIGVSPVMWFIAVIFLLVDVHGWNAYLWLSFLPLITILFIGTKLEVIVARMAMQVTNQNTVIKGTVVVEPNNNLFWFNRPQLVLPLLHFILFMNAFDVAFFIWVTWQFGIKSCYHENVEVIIIRVVLGITVQVLCSYITLPLYALVTQMGSQYKRAILEEHTIHAIKQWHADVKQKKTRDSSNSEDDSRTTMTASTSTEVSVHRRMPTLEEFASRGQVLEITEVIEMNDQDHHLQGYHNFNQIT